MQVITNGLLVNAEWSIEYLIAMSRTEALRILSKKRSLFIFTDVDDPQKSRTTLEDILKKVDLEKIFYLIDETNEIVHELEHLGSLNSLLQGRYVTSIKGELLRIGKTVCREDLNDCGCILDLFEGKRVIELIYLDPNLEVTIVDNYGYIHALDRLMAFEVDNFSVHLLLEELSKIEV